MRWRRWLAAGVGAGGYFAILKLDSATQDSSQLHSNSITTSNETTGNDSSLLHLRQFGVAVIPAAGQRFAKTILNSSDYSDFLEHRQQVRHGRHESFRESTLGRYHRLAFSQQGQDAFAAFEEEIAPLVNQFFGLDASETSAQRLSSQLICSQRQLLVSDVDSACQFYHQDNSKKGLTLLVPLIDVDFQHGPTQLLPGTHCLTDSQPWTARLASLHASLQALGTVQCAARAGDVVAYDARTMHRGMSNRSAIPRPVLVVRFDRRETPPPGHGVLSTCAVRVGATLVGGYAHLIRMAGL